MGRTKLFTETDAIDSIADVFTAHGYGGTSIAMLTDATGLGKQSLYNSFGDKQSLYLKAIDCATARYAILVDVMDSAPTGLTAIQRFFEHIISSCLNSDASANSCIISSGLLEGIDDPVINGTLCSKWNHTHGMLATAIKRGQVDGSIQTKDSAIELADCLMIVMSGLRVTSRAVRQPTRLRKIVNRALALLHDTEVRRMKK
jgi:TetR/AcrR family transcriptional regulator, transcriptional repressor for nem operon